MGYVYGPYTCQISVLGALMQPIMAPLLYKRTDPIGMLLLLTASAHVHALLIKYSCLPLYYQYPSTLICIYACL